MNYGRCAACKYLRRRCPLDCIFSPYFPSIDPESFACVHKIYYASNPGTQDPIYGCAGIISLLYQQIHRAENQLSETKAKMAVLAMHKNFQI
ncbi:hypothetical protein P3X46_009345 [Hevea brasiliensis]|uniref:LOB domain-containing protein n=1 Tax=Hevea brasiliensis TaxID=3981 RepID=A0ABQ9MQ16_HEVBR|nr:hypothetical protein P3X46_009345 [Hevea brasiliensis]